MYQLEVYEREYLIEQKNFRDSLALEGYLLLHFPLTDAELAQLTGTHELKYTATVTLKLIQIEKRVS